MPPHITHTCIYSTHHINARQCTLLTIGLVGRAYALSSQPEEVFLFPLHFSPMLMRQVLPFSEEKPLDDITALKKIESDTEAEEKY